MYAQRNPQIEALPDDFITLAVKGMEMLNKCGRTNVVYSMAKAVGSLRSDGADSLLPCSPMPIGLVEYIVNFFTASSVQKVSTE